MYDQYVTNGWISDLASISDHWINDLILNDKISIAKAPARYVADGPNDQYDAHAVKGSSERSAVCYGKWGTKIKGRKEREYGDTEIGRHL